jgi:hypothetical protein
MNGTQFVNPAGLSTPRGLMAGLMKHGSVAAFRAASPLPKNTQEVLDGAVLKVGRQRLGLVEDLLSMGLTYSLPNWLAIPSLYWERINDVGHAQRTMVPKARGERQVQDRDTAAIPIYCTWDDFSFNIRELMAGARVGAPLDTSMIEQATRNVNEAIEDAAINGGPTIAGLTTPGILNAPNANTDTFKDNEAWTAAAHDGQDIYEDVMGLIEKLQAVKRYGPYGLYLPTAYDNKLDSDYKANGDRTIRERLAEISVGGAPLRIRGLDYMPADTVVMFQMTSDVMDVIVGQTPSVVSWEDAPGWETNFVVLSCIVPRVRDDYEGASGIVIGTPS